MAKIITFMSIGHTYIQYSVGFNKNAYINRY